MAHLTLSNSHRHLVLGQLALPGCGGLALCHLPRRSPAPLGKTGAVFESHQLPTSPIPAPSKCFPHSCATRHPPAARGVSRRMGTFGCWSAPARFRGRWVQDGAVPAVSKDSGGRSPQRRDEIPAATGPREHVSPPLVFIRRRWERVWNRWKPESREGTARASSQLSRRCHSGARGCVFPVPPHPELQLSGWHTRAVAFLERDKPKAKPGISFFFLLFCTLELGF